MHRFALIATLLLTLLVVSPVTASGTSGSNLNVSSSPSAARHFANCAALNKVYPHGVGRKGARDHVSGKSKPVTTFKVSTALYNANTARDRDHDGIACEKK